MVINFLQFSLLILVILGSLLLGLIVLIKNTNNKTNITFALMTFSVTLWSISNFYVDEITNPVLINIILRLDFIFVAFVAYFFSLFIRNFPKESKDSIKTDLALAIPLIITVFLLGFTNSIVSGYQKFAGGIDVEYGILENIYIYESYILLHLVFLGLLPLVNKFRKSYGIVKHQIQFLFIGLSGMIGITLLTNLIFPYFADKSSEIFTIVSRFGVYSTLIFIGATSYAIVKHRLLDIEVIIRRSLIYSTLLASIIIIYSVLIFGLNRLFVPVETISFPRLTDLTAIIVVAFTVDPLRRFIEKITDKIFFKSRYDSEDTIKNISETISEVLDIDQLVNSLRLTLNKTIKINKIAVYVRTDHHFEPIDNLGGFDKRFDTTLEKKYFIGRYFKNNHNLVVADELIRELNKSENKEGKDMLQTVNLLRKNEVGVMMPLVVKDKLTGVIFLGNKLSGDPFSNEDLRLLEIFSHQASIALENARLYQEQKKFSEKLQTEVEQATTSLRTANEKLKELDRLKDEFVSVASHELRTPMTAIKSYVWLALDGKAGKVNPKIKGYLDKVYLSSERMIKLINDMLNVSRIESGRLKLDIQPTSIFKVAESVFSDLSVKAQEEKIKLKLEKDHVIPQALVDPDKLSEIFTNLVGNSIKFTPENGTITISAQKEGAMLAISVTDTGTGISKENMDKLFLKFGRIEDSYATSNTSTGTGLGLFIIKNYIEKMNGKIWVNSELGKGTTFTFSLPTAKTKKIVSYNDR